MAVKYYNLKFGSKKVSGAIIKVDTSKPLEERLKDKTNFETDFQPEFNFLKQTDEGEIYGAIFKNFRYNLRKSLFLHTGYAITEETGEPNKHIKFLVTDNGELKIIEKPKYMRVYLEKMNNKKAKEKTHEAFLHSAKLDYICGA